MPYPKATEVNLGKEEQTGLEQLVRRHNIGQQIALRARIVLAAGQGQSNSAIARALKVSIKTPRNAGEIVLRKHRQFLTTI
jgi:DNA-binding NarL/FixJ family response regulator